MLALADEAGFRIRSFHHALEAYKIRDELKERTIAVSTWADWWGFKLEAYDGIPENLALVSAGGGRAVVHSDSAEGIRRLNQEAAKGMYAGRRRGLDISEGEAIRWVTLNPAWALGIDERVGSLAVGKDADVVVWDKSPLSVYASAERVLVDGVERYRRGSDAPPWSDFEAAPRDAERVEDEAK
jgi:imidazolonepropionase-like amidohydrolase